MKTTSIYNTDIKHIQEKEWLVGNLNIFLFLILGINNFSH